jgi:hypothetical protein
MCTSSNPLLWFFKRDSDAFFLFLIRKKRVVTMPAAINRAMTTPAIMLPFEAVDGEERRGKESQMKRMEM